MTMQGLGPWDPFGGARWEPIWDPFHVLGPLCFHLGPFPIYLGPWDTFGGVRRLILSYVCLVWLFLANVKRQVGVVSLQCFEARKPSRYSDASMVHRSEDI